MTALQEVRLLTVIQEVTAILLTEPIQTVHHSIVEKACDLLNAQDCILWLCEENQLVAKAALNPKIAGWRINQKDSLIGKAMFEEKNSIIPNANQDFPDAIGQTTNYGQTLISSKLIGI